MRPSNAWRHRMVRAWRRRRPPTPGCHSRALPLSQLLLLARIRRYVMASVALTTALVQWQAIRVAIARRKVRASVARHQCCQCSLLAIIFLVALCVLTELRCVLVAAQVGLSYPKVGVPGWPGCCCVWLALLNRRCQCPAEGNTSNQIANTCYVVRDMTTRLLLSDHKA